MKKVKLHQTAFYMKSILLHRMYHNLKMIYYDIFKCLNKQFPYPFHQTLLGWNSHQPHPHRIATDPSGMGCENVKEAEIIEWSPLCIF